VRMKKVESTAEVAPLVGRAVIVRLSLVESKTVVGDGGRRIETDVEGETGEGGWRACGGRPLADDAFEGRVGAAGAADGEVVAGAGAERGSGGDGGCGEGGG
jgi:hypothetical protein